MVVCGYERDIADTALFRLWRCCLVAVGDGFVGVRDGLRDARCVAQRRMCGLESSGTPVRCGRERFDFLIDVWWTGHGWTWLGIGAWMCDGMIGGWIGISLWVPQQARGGCHAGLAGESWVVMVV